MDYSKESNMRKKKAAVSKTKKAQNRIVTVAFRFIVALSLVIIFAVSGVVLGAYVGIIEGSPTIENLATPTGFNTNVYDMYGNLIWEFHQAGLRRVHAPFDIIPKHLINAFIAIEDERFWEHHGVDVRGTLRALYVTFIAQSGTEGGSTITQQLIKNEVMGLMTNNATTKLQEQFLALQLEAYFTERYGSHRAAKEQILYRYLNSIALGPGIHGVQMASNHYFGRGVETLTISESAVIASITQSPHRLDPSVNPDYNRVRATTVLNRMLAQGLITEYEHIYALNDLQYAVYERIGNFREYRGAEDIIQSYFIDHLVEEVVEALIDAGLSLNRRDAMSRIHGGGLRIHSTVHQTIQRILEETYLEDSHFPANAFQLAIDSRISATNNETGEFRDFIASPEVTFVPNYYAYQDWLYNRRNYITEQGYTITWEFNLPIVQPQSAMVIIDHHTGQIRGIVGGRGEKTENLSLNRATQSLRSPGSVFKMFASYAPAFDLGIVSPGTRIADRPFTINWYGEEISITNFANNYRGTMPVREAVARSINTIPSEILLEVGIDRAFDYLENFGFTTLIRGLNQNGFTDSGPSLALGGLTYGITQLELAAAFAAVANGGLYIQPTSFTRIYDHDGNLLLESNQIRRQVIQPTTAYLLTSTMQDVVLRSYGTGGAARLANGMATAGKTGTSQWTNDLMFGGYSPHFTASVWIGHDQPRSLPSNHGGPHTRIWSHVMNRIHTELNKPIITGFNRPSGVVEATINVNNGLIARPWDVSSGRAETDIFAANAAPTEYSPGPELIVRDTLTGQPATPATPYYRREQILGRVDASGRIIEDEVILLDNNEDDDEDNENPYEFHAPGDDIITGTPIDDGPEEIMQFPTIIVPPTNIDPSLPQNIQNEITEIEEEIELPYIPNFIEEQFTNWPTQIEEYDDYYD